MWILDMVENDSQVTKCINNDDGDDKNKNDDKDNGKSQS